MRTPSSGERLQKEVPQIENSPAMTMINAEACEECGARITPDAEQCDLCGAPVSGAPSPAGADHDEPYSGTYDVAPQRAEAAVFCNTCGWKNPDGARFCSQCGDRLQELSAEGLLASVPSAGAHAGVERRAPVLPPTHGRGQVSDGSVGQRVFILVAAGTLLVAALYLVTVFSRSIPSAPGTANTSAAPAVERDAAPLPPDVAERAAVLQAGIAQEEGEARLAKQRELVGLYLSSGRIDLAAGEQERLAQAAGTPAEWANTGNYYYGWMEEEEGEVKLQAGRKAIEAYERVLALQPDNLGVRTDLATVLLNTNSPMEGVREVKQVLEADPNHLQANFNYGVMLSMIGRREQAIAQFEKVKTLVAPTSEEYRTADEAIRQLKAAPAPGGPARAPTSQS